MKKLTDLAGIILFAILALTGILWITYKIKDWFEVRVDKLPESMASEHYSTTFPEEPILDFNSWMLYINRQL